MSTLRIDHRTGVAVFKTGSIRCVMDTQYSDYIGIRVLVADCHGSIDLNWNAGQDKLRREAAQTLIADMEAPR